VKLNYWLEAVWVD